MKVDLESFASWDDVLKHASTGKRLFYQGPLDPTLRLILVRRVYKNGKIRIGPASGDANYFTADRGHLDRFRRIAEP